VSYRIEIRREALRELKDLPAYVRAEALQRIDGLQENPRPARAKQLRDKPGLFRLWVAAHWRLVYGVEDDDARVLVLRIRHKDQIDYESLTSQGLS
jgi:mRNA interferase RelE/StbE